MVAHLDAKEQDLVHELAQKGKTSTQILARITTGRAKKGKLPPQLQAITRAVRLRTFKRGAKEARGRKPVWTPANARKVNSVRKKLLTQAKGEKEVSWKHIIKKAKVPMTDASTARRSLERIGVSVEARWPWVFGFV